jgi:hypothetical protein
MGTTKEWVEVVLAATFWGGLMLLVKVLERKGAWTKSVMPGRQGVNQALESFHFTDLGKQIAESAAIPLLEI